MIKQQGFLCCINRDQRYRRMEQTPYIQASRPRRRFLWKQDSENATECIDLHASPDVFWVRMQAQACRVQSLGLSAYICCIYFSKPKHSVN